MTHQKEAKRAHPPQYSPKWNKLKSVPAREHKVCVQPCCNTQEKLVTPLFAPVSEIMAALKIKQQVKNFKLCPEHYQELYRQLVGARPCASCNIKPPKGTHFTRYSPNSDLINSILGVAEFDGTEPLASTDYICNTCYKLHVAILKSHENENELADLIQIWEITLSNETSELTAAVLHSVLFVDTTVDHFTPLALRVRGNNDYFLIYFT